MTDKHPIDDLFRRGLADAEVAPPASVWEGIVARQSWSERMLGSIRKYWWVPLLFLMFTGAGIGASIGYETSDVREDDFADMTSTPQGAEAMLSSSGHSAGFAENIASPEEEAGADAAVSTEEHADKAKTSAFPSGTADKSDRTERRSIDPTITTGHSGSSDVGINTGISPTHNTVKPSTFTLRSASEMGSLLGNIENAEGHRRETSYLDVSASMLNTRQSPFSNPVGKGSTRGGRYTGSAGSIPPGDWWVGLSAGYSQLNVSYMGGQDVLISELENGENGKHSISFDFLGGRAWRNGLYVSAGIGADNWTTDASYTQSRMQISSSIDSIFVVGYDSITQSPITDTTFLTTTTTRDEEFGGRNRYTLFRIPLSVGWMEEFGRWELGVQGGLVFEFDSGRKGFTLESGSAASDSLLLSEFSVSDLAAENLNPRYGFGMSGNAGLVLGYKLNEFLSVWAMPEYSSRLSTFSSSDLALYGDRYGVRFGMRYTIPY